jgi:crotonobetainyl-CoA:carnitine CoA-transferase CaiB-like acyl-CoA transferase
MNETANGKPGPLKGVKIVDLTRALAGPTCTMILADMGAETIKVEQPPGCGSRRTATLSGDEEPQPINRNKKSITLNLRSEKAKEIFPRLLQWGDVVVENYRTGFLKRVGFDYPVMREINPRIILTSISGYGQTGPYSKRAAYDIVGQAMGGLMSVTGPADMPPMDAGAAVCDITAGLFGALGTMFALYHQKTTGLGQHVDASLVESIVSLMGLNLSLHNMGRAPKKGELLSPTRTPGAGMYSTKDGKYLVIMAQSDQHWPILARLIDREDLAAHPDYIARGKRSRHGPEIDSIVEAWVREYTIDEAETLLDKVGLPFGRVQNLEDVLKDPHLEARNRFQYFEFRGKQMPMIAPYPLLSETPGSVHSLWPTIGQHNREIYHKGLGFSLDEIETFENEGVI